MILASLWKIRERNLVPIFVTNHKINMSPPPSCQQSAPGIRNFLNVEQHWHNSCVQLCCAVFRHISLFLRNISLQLQMIITNIDMLIRTTSQTQQESDMKKKYFLCAKTKNWDRNLSIMKISLWIIVCGVWVCYLFINNSEFWRSRDSPISLAFHLFEGIARVLLLMFELYFLGSKYIHALLLQILGDNGQCLYLGVICPGPVTLCILFPMWIFHHKQVKVESGGKTGQR